MNIKEKNKLIKEMKKYAKRVSKDKKEAKRFLSLTGIYTKTGRLTKHYK